MKTPIEFDYDLWTTEDGKCMVRVKSTGEVSEVDRETMRFLRAEEKRMRRGYAARPNNEDDQQDAPILSLDELPADDVKAAAWLADPIDYEELVTTSMLEDSFRRLLTARQFDVYEKCMKGGISMSEYARHLGVDFSTVKEVRNAIRKKLKKFFDETP